ncbi:MAG: hypothetical protein J1F71_03745, partial [Clostridiales bacterium]|nr:hypothetical protein [Clostridiales bacterium]
ISKVWAKGGSAIVGVTGAKDEQGVNITGDTVTVLAGGTYTISISQYQDQVGENKVSIYIGAYAGPWDNNTDPDNPDNPDNPETEATLKHGTTNVEFGTSDKGDDTCEWQLEAKSVSLTQGETLQFMVDGTAVQVWMEGHVKDATCGKTHICTVAIEGFKTNPRPTSFKVLTTGVYDFYLKYYGPFDGASNGGYVVWVEGPGEAGTNDDEYVEGDYYIVGIGGVWNTVQSKYHLGATKGSLTLTLTANAEFKIAKCGTDGATDWDSANYGREAVVAGVGYLDSTSTNIKIKTAGTYTISFNNGEISISSSDVTEPGVNLPATKLTLKFNDATITVGFDYPDYGTEGPWIYVFKGSNPVDSTNGAWPGYKLDGSQVTINANLADCKIIISFKQGNDTKQSFDTDTTKFKDGSSYLLSIGNWADDGTGTWKYNLVIVEA